MKRKRKINKKFIKFFKTQIYSKQFLESNRKSKEDFTRERKLTFPRLILFMLNSVKKSLQKELTEFSYLLKDKRVKNITNSAFCQSRMKLNYNAFIQLNDGIIGEFYTDNIFELWKGFRLLAIDGSKIQLPFSLEVIEDFGFAGNQGLIITPMAQTSSCFDVLNKMIINSEIDRYETDEYFLALKHIAKCNMKDLFIYDRGYCAPWFMFYHLVKKKDFIIRMQSNSIKEVQDFFNSDEKDKIIEIKELANKSAEKVRELNLEFKPFKIRLVKVILDNGEVEVLATSLINKEGYPASEFKKLYSFRWGIETEFDHLKNHLLIEDFTGLSSLSVLQDFYANLLIANFQQILISNAEEELKEKKKDAKYEYKINKNLSFGFMKDRFIKIMLDQDKTDDKTLEELKELFFINPTPIREGRKFPRVYHKTRKKFYIKKKRAI
jgi:hypothetical protein